MKEWLTYILLKLLGADLPAAGERVEWRLSGNWTWRPATVVLFCALGALSLLFVGWIYVRERSTAGRNVRVLLALLRLSTIALVALVMLYGLRLNCDRTSLPYLAVVVDESESMREQDDYGPDLKERLDTRRQQAGLPTLSRIDVAKGMLLSDNAALLRRLSARYRVQLYAMAGTVRRLSGDLEQQLAELRKLEATGQSSRLGTNVRSVADDLRGTQAAAMVLYTDGITTDGPTLSEFAPLARRKGMPLYLVATGSDKPARSIELQDLLAPEVVMVNDSVEFDFKLSANGLTGRTINLVLRDKKTGDVLARQSVIAGESGQTQRVRLSHRPKEVGRRDYAIDVETPREELRNQVEPLSKSIDVRKAKIKVLLAQCYPSYEYRYLKNLLMRDETIELKTLLQEADIEHAEQDRTALRVFPVSRENLFKFDVLLFGDVDPGQLSPSVLTNVADFVKVKGGGVLLFSGPRFNPSAYRETPLAALFPFEVRTAIAPPDGTPLTEPIPVRPTPLGLATPHMQLGDTPAETERIWSNLPDAYWMIEVPELRPAARVLAEHPVRTSRDGRKVPLIVAEHLPPGKVIWHAIDETYRWRFRVGDPLFARYWIQTIRYLARSTIASKTGPIQLTSDRRDYERAAPVLLRVRFLDERLAPASRDGVTVVIEGEGQKKLSVKLQRDAASPEIFSNTVADLPAGTYHAWVASPTSGTATPEPINFKVLAPQGERAKIELDLAEMTSAAELSSGKFYTLRDADRLSDDLPTGKAVRVESKPPEPLWNKWQVLTLFVGLLVGEWLLRKRKGML